MKWSSYTCIVMLLTRVHTYLLMKHLFLIEFYHFEFIDPTRSIIEKKQKTQKFRLFLKLRVLSVKLYPTKRKLLFRQRFGTPIGIISNTFTCRVSTTPAECLIRKGNGIWKSISTVNTDETLRIFIITSVYTFSDKKQKVIKDLSI